MSPRFWRRGLRWVAAVSGGAALATGVACSTPSDPANEATGAATGSGASGSGAQGGVGMGTGGGPVPGAGNGTTATGGTGNTGGAGATGPSAGAPSSTGGGGATGSGGASTGGTPTSTAGSGQVTAGAPPVPPGGGLVIDGTCVAACASTVTDSDGDGCGYDTRDCVLTSAPFALDAMACEYDGTPPAAGDGFFMGCRCVRPCAGADTSDPLDDGWGWEFGATCVVTGGPAVTGKAACVPPTMATGDGYLIKTMVEGGEEVEKCVPACTKPEWVDDPDGWGYENRDTCIVVGSKAEMQVGRCTLTPRTFPWEPGDGYMLQDGTTGEEICFPPCLNPDDTDPTDDGWGYEMERTCVVPDTKPALQGAPCIPAAADVEGTCPTDTMCPTVDGQAVKCGCTWVDGFKERKAEILVVATGTPSWGDARYFLASAMMETDTLTADYPLGDVYPNGQMKTGDAFNAGIAKQNWGMMRQCHPAWNGSSDYMQSAAMNSSLTLDFQVYGECRSMFGDNWWSGHRNGAGSLGSSTHDIRVFKAAMDWIWTELQEGTGHFSDDVYFWADVTAI